MGEHPGTFRRGRHIRVKPPADGPIRTIEQKNGRLCPNVFFIRR